MATKIVVPALGESIIEATVGRWLKKPGETVEIGETVVEIETDKVNLEVGAESSGVLQEVLKEEGQDVGVGDVLGMIQPSGKTTPAREKGGSSAGEPEESPPETSAVNMAPDTPSPQDVKTESLQPSEAEVAVSKLPDKKDRKGTSGESGNTGQPSKQVEAEDKITPLAKRLADDYGVDAATIPGTGAGGRVTRQDVERIIRPSVHPTSPTQPSPSGPPQDAPSIAQPPSPLMVSDRREERIRMTRRRRTIAQRLVEAQHTAAILTTFNDVDMAPILEIRKRRRQTFQEKFGVKLGIVPFFIKAVIAALKDFPRLNAEIQGDEIILKHYYDIGIAVGAEEGLVVPVLKDADRLSFAEIESSIEGFVQKARQGSFNLEDLRGGTFTITNGGVFGSLLSTPILNYPEVGILGIHRIEDRPVAIDGQVVIRPMMYLALSYDHRIVDGREAVQFLARVKELVENPDLLLLGA
jgi:2-oxoglutarate dehydrogenase E2 component (dihydrolipoamide succinyltransferase)